jgi:hypothetical protein
MAELNAAEKESDRIALYRSIVDVIEEYEEVADKMARAVRGAQKLIGRSFEATRDLRLSLRSCRCGRKQPRQLKKCHNSKSVRNR